MLYSKWLEFLEMLDNLYSKREVTEYLKFKSIFPNKNRGQNFLCDKNIAYNIANTIKQGKNVILNSIESNIEEKFNEQYIGVDNLEKYIKNWKNDFNNKDFEAMEKEYNKIEKELESLAPIEKTISQARIIENLHNLIKNNGQNFNLSQEQLQLAEKLL